MRHSQVTPAALAWFLHLGSKAGNKKKISMNSILRILATHRTGELKNKIFAENSIGGKQLFACHTCQQAIEWPAIRVGTSVPRALSKASIPLQEKPADAVTDSWE